MKLLKYELYRLCRQPTVWSIVAAVVAAGMLIAYLSQRYTIGMPLEIVTPLALTNPLIPMWSGVVLAPLFFGLDFQNRTWNIPICSGYSRGGILMTKALGYYLFGAAALAISGASAIWISYGGITPLPLGKLALLALINGATLTIPMVVAFLFRDLFATVATSAIFTYVMQNLMDNRTALDAISFYPPYMQLDFARWSTWPTAFACALISVSYIAAGLLICFLILKRRELK